MTPAAQRAEDKAMLRAGILQLADDAARYRSLFTAVWHVALTAQMRVHELERRVSELMDERERYARTVFPGAKELQP